RPAPNPLGVCGCYSHFLGKPLRHNFLKGRSPLSGKLAFWVLCIKQRTIARRFRKTGRLERLSACGGHVDFQGWIPVAQRSRAAQSERGYYAMGKNAWLGASGVDNSMPAFCLGAVQPNPGTGCVGLGWLLFLGKRAQS